MSLAHFEFRALKAIEAARNGSNPEDDGVELKLEMPTDHQRVARRIAAMANAARGEPFLWLIGVDERTGEIARPTFDLNSWWAKVSSFFAGDPPAMRSSHLDDALMLVFESEAPPYVVRTRQEKNEKGLPELEVPWREGSGTRSATRSDLLRLLVPILRTPEIEVMSGELKIGTANTATRWLASLEVRLIVIPRSSEMVTLLAHRATLAIESPDGTSLVDGAPTIHFNHVNGSLAEASSSSQVYCKGPGPVSIGSGAVANPPIALDPDEVVVKCTLGIALDASPAHFTLRLRRVPKTDSNIFIWR